MGEGYGSRRIKQDEGMWLLLIVRFWLCTEKNGKPLQCFGQRSDLL